MVIHYSRKPNTIHKLISSCSQWSDTALINSHGQCTTSQAHSHHVVDSMLVLFTWLQDDPCLQPGLLFCQDHVVHLMRCDDHCNILTATVGDQLTQEVMTWWLTGNVQQRCCHICISDLQPVLLLDAVAETSISSCFMLSTLLWNKASKEVTQLFIVDRSYTLLCTLVSWCFWLQPVNLQ